MPMKTGRDRPFEANPFSQSARGQPVVFAPPVGHTRAETIPYLWAVGPFDLASDGGPRRIYAADQVVGRN